jgi:hypothetical protein
MEWCRGGRGSGDGRCGVVSHMGLPAARSRGLRACEVNMVASTMLRVCLCTHKGGGWGRDG